MGEASQRSRPWFRHLLERLKKPPSASMAGDGSDVDGVSTGSAAGEPRRGGDIMAIFVHAGAGYHSVQNEEVHLSACANSASTAMTLLRNGYSAVEAVELALMMLEDNDITNAGRGSNLTLDGTVELDASIVDHCGRSGAVGAVSHIRNPISVARMILDDTCKPMPLRRVPPNLLVGQGAHDYAVENGVPPVRDDFIVTTAARQRWLKWTEDLANVHSGSGSGHVSMPSGVAALALQNEAQPSTPRPPTSPSEGSVSPSPDARHRRQASPARSSARNARRQAASPISPVSPEPAAVPAKRKMRNVGPGADGELEEEYQAVNQDASPSTPDQSSSTSEHNQLLNAREDCKDKAATNRRSDDVIDTVGAIAIDCHGNIAAGSSSGGIGMKRSGRIGPAALVGVGTAVVPARPGDPQKTSVATVVSGTGEHMATTLAAQTCSNRIYIPHRIDAAGVPIATYEDDALRAFMENDFKDHPSVVTSHASAAIGILCVKHTVDGATLLFGHNTESFALASMSSEDSQPYCLMSRGTKEAMDQCPVGGRSMKWMPRKPLPRTAKKRRTRASDNTQVDDAVYMAAERSQPLTPPAGTRLSSPMTPTSSLSGNASPSGDSATADGGVDQNLF